MAVARPRTSARREGSTGDHVHFEVNRYGDEVYVAGETGDEIYARTGVAKNYALSNF